MSEGLRVEEAFDTLALAQVRELFVEYAAWLGVDLAFQQFEQELAGLPGAYARPRGRLLLARVEGQAAACLGLRPLATMDAQGEGCAELKRLWVRPPFRQRGIAHSLVDQALREARDSGYARLVLDTLPHMQSALALYRSFGFRETAPYYDNPLPGTVYLELAL